MTVAVVVVPLLFFALPTLSVAQDHCHVPISPFPAVLAVIALRDALPHMTECGQAYGRHKLLASSSR